jgi:predicted transcriptional regulator
MSKDVLLSIKPQWVRLILSGEKTLELRRGRPTQDTPFKVYIYESLGEAPSKGRQKVVGEFVCDYIQRDINPSFGIVDVVDQKRSCVHPQDIIAYARARKKKPQLVFWWNITQVKEYDIPKDLSEFGLETAPQSWAFVRNEEYND